ncbi:hypothetical protein TorRG33x02_042850, partial [Trema orientale]
MIPSIVILSIPSEVTAAWNAPLLIARPNEERGNRSLFAAIHLSLPYHINWLVKWVDMTYNTPVDFDFRQTHPK